VGLTLVAQAAVQARLFSSRQDRRFIFRAKEIAMNKDQVKGAGHEAKGAVKEAVGKVTKDTSTEVEGKVEKNLGTAQRKTGDAKEALKDTLNKK
jgi:uncharacterized protein YjbJ (UPF0337 family)